MATEQLTKIEEPTTNIDVFIMLGKLGDLGRALTDDEFDELPPNVREQYLMAQTLSSKLTSVDNVADQIVSAFKDLIEQNGILDPVDSFSINKAVDTALFAVVGEQPSQLLSPEYMRARKQTLQKIIQIIQSERIAEDDPAKPKTRALVAALRSGLFGQSPSLMDYVGGMSDRLDVLSDMSKTPELVPFYVSQLGSIVYDMSFMNDKDFNMSVGNFVHNKTTAQQLLNIRLLEDVAGYAHNEGYEAAGRLPERICCALDDVDSETMSFLPYRIMTTFINHVRVGEDGVDELARYIIDDDKELAERVRLGGQYQHGFTPTLLARGLIGARSEYGIVEAVGAEDETGTVVPADFMDAVRKAGINASDDDLLMFQELQRPEIKGYIEWQFGGIKLEELTLAAQFQLVRFASTRSFNDFCRLADTSSCMGERTRGDFLETFLALEFGDHLGESILQIAEKSDKTESGYEVLTLILSIRENLDLWEANAWFASPNSGYSEYFNGIRRAIEERISQILSPTPDLMDGIAQQAQYYHRNDEPSSTFDINTVGQVIQGLKVLNLMIKKIALAEEEPISERRAIVEDDFMSSSAQFGSSAVRITMRPYETSQAEARVRWAVVITPEEQLDIFGQYLDVNSMGNPRNSRVSLRLDLEKISGRLSFDFGSSAQYGSSLSEYPNELLAALITAGVQHDARQNGIEDIAHVDYHVRTFNELLGKPDEFAKFVTAMQMHYFDGSMHELGQIGLQAGEFLEGGGETLQSDVAYTGVFFDDDVIESVNQNIFGEKRYANTFCNNPHVTIKFRPKNGAEGVNIGEQITVRIVGYVDDGNAQVLIVSSDSEEISTVKRPHITVSTGNSQDGKKISPAYSNYAIKQASKAGKVMWLDKPIELVGRIGYFDRKTGQVVVRPA